MSVLLGCLKGWHGCSDIIIQDLPVTVIQGNSQLEDDFDESDNQSFSSIDVKLAGNFTKRDLSQIISQTIVFSFLQRKFNDKNLENYLIPGIGISERKLLICFYDSVNEVLLQSFPITLFEEKSISLPAVLFLWLTLNYRLFCTGITLDMKAYKADFLKKLGDCLNIYVDEVTMPMHVPHVTEYELCPWSTKPKTSDFRQKSKVKFVDLSDDDK